MEGSSESQPESAPYALANRQTSSSRCRQARRSFARAFRVGQPHRGSLLGSEARPLLAKIVRNGNQTTLDAALDHLQQNHPDAYGALADMAETHSESFVIEHEGTPYEALLIAAPVLAWTRYMIPSGPLKGDAVDALRAHLHAHVLAGGTRVAIAPFLYSIDQLPRHHVETYRLASN